MAAIDDDRLMMYLAGLSYRGFWRVDRGSAHAGAIANEVGRGLKDAGLASWDIVWGPACFRPPFAVFDDVVMYVLHNRISNPERYVIAIRGTNPISLTDWIFGDLLADPPIPWPFGTGANVTPSTAFGLAILLGLGAKPEIAAARTQRLINGIDVAKAKARASVAHRAASRWDPGHLLVRAAFAFNRRGRISIFKNRGRRPNKKIDTAMAGVRKDLIAYLRDAAVSGNIEITVTGHSKGGALAAALAAWLSQTRTDRDDAWDPEGKARLRCVTFAGPTPGNETFNTLLLQSLEPGDFRRCWNRYDIVPHAFGWNDLEEIREIYNAKLISGVLEALRNTVKPAGYSQIGPGIPFPELTDLPSQKLSVTDAIDNHMQEYLQHFDIPEPTAWFFLGTDPHSIIRRLLKSAGHHDAAL
jgi:hypothetical protein